MEFREYYQKKAVKFAADLLAIALLLIGFYGSLGQSVGSAIFYVLKVVACVILATKLLWLSHGDALCLRLVNGLLWSRRYLKKAPPPLSQVQALIMSGKLEEAEERLKQWHQEYPGSVSIALTYFGLLADRCQRYDDALKIACETLESPFRTPKEDAMILLGRTIDLFCREKLRYKALLLLQQESEKDNLYAPIQIQRIKQRETVMRKDF